MELILCRMEGIARLQVDLEAKRRKNMMEITVNVKLKINTISNNATPKSIMDVAKWKIENITDEAQYEVIDWELAEEKQGK